jgi:hypothetical protein
MERDDLPIPGLELSHRPLVGRGRLFVEGLLISWVQPDRQTNCEQVVEVVREWHLVGDYKVVDLVPIPGVTPIHELCVRPLVLYT